MSYLHSWIHLIERLFDYMPLFSFFPKKRKGGLAPSLTLDSTRSRWDIPWEHRIIIFIRIPEHLVLYRFFYIEMIG